MQKEIYIIRHGETDFNKNGIVQGRGVNSDLNETGQAQARAFYEAYRHLQFDRVYTSALKRTHQTVAHFVNDAIPWEQLDGLDELSFGIWEGAPNQGEWKDAFGKIDQCWRSGDCDQAFEKGESPNQVAARLQQAFETIVSRTDEQRVLVCMHGRALLILLCVLNKVPVHNMVQFSHSNTGLYRVSYSNGAFSILETNCTKHLQTLPV